MPSFVTPAGGRLREFNKCHNPAGDEGGQFCSDPAGGPSGATRKPVSHQLQVGITSYRAEGTPGPGDRTHEQAWARMGELVSALEKQGHEVAAQNVQGAWDGAWEPSWMVGINPGESWDASAAERTLAEFGKRFNQDGVLLLHQCNGDDCNSEIADLAFDAPLGQDRRDAIGKVLGAAGFGGWTWYKGADGRTTLRMAHVPAWAERDLAAHQAAVESIRQRLHADGYATTMSASAAKATVMEREARQPPVEGVRSYDEVLSGTARDRRPLPHPKERPVAGWQRNFNPRWAVD